MHKYGDASRAAKRVGRETRDRAIPEVRRSERNMADEDAAPLECRRIYVFDHLVRDFKAVLPYRQEAYMSVTIRFCPV
ncbi:MAG: hypothetical protein H0W30_20535 [Gemmatimonadaceae bacterium]|nr:hypothetical protein [Gemmatimonadaceae bacterium]MDQ3517611.1 hypothetical protein [Gemmatimonadota bacterium]